MLHPPPLRPRASNRLIDKLAEDLGERIPSSRIIRDPDILEAYGSDESGAGAYLPQILARPKTTEEVIEIMKAASFHGVPVVPRGAGTGRAGGCLPIEGGIVISMESMNRILSIDPQTLTARIQPGVITGLFHEAVEDERLFYAPDPSSLDSCHIGGNVATNASGPRNPKYGPTRDHIRGLQVVLPTGDLIQTGGKTLKGVAGYDLTSLICGSEGTLGIITEIIVRLLPKPRYVETALLFFPGTTLAANAVVEIMRSGYRPRALEMMDNVAVDAVRGKTGFRFPEGDQTALILEMDGNDQDAVFNELVCIGEMADCKLGASLVLVAKNNSERNSIWASRRIMSPALKELYGFKYAEDVAVPLDKMPELVDRAHIRAADQGVTSALYGHAGDGNLHVNILFSEKSAWPAAMRAASAIFKDAVELGGTITSEHGVGLIKRDYMPLEQGPQLLALQREIKRVFDPANIMNPGKIFPLPSKETHLPPVARPNSAK